MKKKILILFIASSFFLVSCNQQNSEWKGTIIENDGVVIIRNPRNPIFKKDFVSIEEDLSIGQVEGTEEYMFNRIFNIDVDEDENIYIVDTPSAHVRVFDREGKFLRLIGNMGQGPGEMQRPYYIQIISQGELFVQDPLTRRFLVFSLEGIFQKQISLARIRFPMHPVRIDSRENLITFIVPPPPMGGTELKKFNSKLEQLLFISKNTISDSDLKDEIRLLKPSLYCVVSKMDNIIWGNSERYELQILNPDGKLVKQISKLHKAIKLTDWEKQQLRKSSLGLSAVKQGFKTIIPDFYPAYQHLSVDDDGRIFVKTYERVGENERDFYFDVFDPEGRFIIKFSHWIKPQVWKKGKVYTIESDDDGFPVVKRYKVTWNY